MKMFGSVNFWLPFLSGWQALGIIVVMNNDRPLWIVVMYALLLIFTIGTYVFMFKHGQDKE